MLGKLLKYEWRATSRTLLPLYGSVIIMALINRLFWTVGIGSGHGNSYLLQELPSAIASFVYAGLIVASFVATLVLLIQRFYKSLLGDEGYLMFTLPVTVTQHIWAKTIIAFIMCVLSGLATMLSIVVLALDGNNIKYFFRGLSQVLDLFGQQPHVVLLCIEGTVFLALAVLSSILSIYLCIAIGHLAKRHRIAGAIGAYFGLSILAQIFISVFANITNATSIQKIFMNMSNIGLAHLLLLFLIAVCAVSGFLHFFFTRFILVRRLNLE